MRDGKRSWGGFCKKAGILVAIGVDGDGRRETIGRAEGLTEPRDSWRGFLLWPRAADSRESAWSPATSARARSAVTVNIFFTSWGCGGNPGPKQGYTEDHMSSADQRKLAIETYIKFDLSAADTVAELGYPTRHSLRAWYKDYLEQVEFDFLDYGNCQSAGKGFVSREARIPFRTSLCKTSPLNL